MIILNRLSFVCKVLFVCYSKFSSGTDAVKVCSRGFVKQSRSRFRTAIGRESGKRKKDRMFRLRRG